MRSPLIRRVRSGMALLTLGLLAIGLMKVAPSPLLSNKPYSESKTPKGNKPQLVEAYRKLPLSFEANHGQTDSRVNFLSRGSGYTLFLSPTEAVLALSNPGASSPRTRHAPPDNPEAKKAPTASVAVLRMKLLGANPSPRVSGLEELPGKSNYFLGNDPQKWRTNVPTYAKVQYQDVYPGVDLIYYGNQRQLEYDLVVAPGADPKAIQLAFEGGDKLEIGAQGDLELHGAGGQVRLQKPLVYQETDGIRREISGGYVLNAGRQVSFQVGAYDVSKTLVIDPVLVYSTYLGGAGDDRSFGIAVDASGNAYVTGTTHSTDFPTASPVQPDNRGGSSDAFVTKLNAAGNALVYSTYLGGNRDESGLSIAVDSSGSAYLHGDTESNNFPTANPIQPARGGAVDAFVTKLNAAGNALVYSTYLGGSLNDFGFDICLDAAGNAYVTGIADSTDFPTASPVQPANGGLGDAFVTKLNAAGNALVYSTYLGGSLDDFGFAIGLDAAGNAYVTGVTESTNFPTASPIQLANGGGPFDGFVTKLNATGSALVYSTYLGGGGDDRGLDIAVDAAGNTYVTGLTDSTNFPTASPIQPANAGGDDVFVTKLNAAGAALVYSTYLGGGDSDQGQAIAVDASGNVYVTGAVGSSNFPTLNPLQPTNAGLSDAFIAKITDQPQGTPTLPANSGG